MVQLVEELQEKLKSFLDEQGRLVTFPTKHIKKSWAIFYLAQKLALDPEHKYSEAEINDAIDQWIAPNSECDHCTLRRELYDYRFLEREKNGSVYWISNPQPDPIAFSL